MPDYDVITLILKRNAYYRKLYLRALIAAFLGVWVIVGLVFILITIVREPSQPLYFPIDPAGHLIDETPLNRPNMPPDQIKAWVIKVVESASTFNFVNYRSQLQDLSRYFTDRGLTTFKKALSVEGLIQAVVQRKWIMTARVSGDITIMQEGLLNGSYAWKFSLPLLVTTWSPPYDSNSKGLTPLKVVVIVARQPLLQSESGLGIVQYYSYNAATTTTINEEEMAF